MKYLREIFDKPYEYEHTGTISKNNFSPPLKTISYRFGSASKDYHVFLHKEGPKTNLVFGDQNQRIDNTHDERHPTRVFSTIHQIVKHHLAAHPDVNHIQFSGAKSSGRDKLYRMMSKRVAHQHSEDDMGNGVEFNILRQHMK